MASTLVDSPPAPETEPKADDQVAAGGPQPPVQIPSMPIPAAAPACANCGAALAAGQDWCLQCGSGTQAGSTGSGWRPAASILVVTALLVLGAAAAGYAALSKSGPKRNVLTQTVAQAAPVTPPPATTTPTTPLGTPGAVNPLGTTVKPPKIPLTVPTPATTTPATTTPTTTTKSKATGPTGGANSEAKPKAILLDTDAAATYNPYNYASTLFGDPRLTIDGDTTTAWTAQINPETSPRLAEGVLINLRTARKLASLTLFTSSPGMTIQVYGANGHTVPSSITDSAWVTLSHLIVVKKHKVTIKLKEQQKGFVFAALWISQAGEKSLGTATAPGHVSVDEIELFPPKA